MTYDFLFLYHRYNKSKKDNSSMSYVKVLDIFGYLVFPTLLQNLHSNVRRALIIKLIVNHICI